MAKQLIFRVNIWEQNTETEKKFLIRYGQSEQKIFI